MLNSRAHIGDHRFDQALFCMYRRQVQRRLSTALTGPSHGGQQQWPAGERFTPARRVGRSHVPAPPVVDQRHRARNENESFDFKTDTGLSRTVTSAGNYFGLHGSGTAGYIPTLQDSSIHIAAFLLGNQFLGSGLEFAERVSKHITPGLGDDSYKFFDMLHKNLNMQPMIQIMPHI
jgi:hypothetical protein